MLPSACSVTSQQRSSLAPGPLCGASPDDSPTPCRVNVTSNSGFAAGFVDGQHIEQGRLDVLDRGHGSAEGGEPGSRTRVGSWSKVRRSPRCTRITAVFSNMPTRSSAYGTHCHAECGTFEDRSPVSDPHPFLGFMFWDAQARMPAGPVWFAMRQ
jgi:hypothetical protein